MTTNASRTVCYGKKGGKDGEFKYPSGITVDEKDHMYVTDTQNHRVMVLPWIERATSTWLRQGIIEFRNSVYRTPSTLDTLQGHHADLGR